MSETWNTKWGPRRVRVELPTLEEALDAAAGMTGEKTAQVQMAAELMGVTAAEIAADADRILRANVRRPQMIRSATGRTAVTVERKSARRILRPH